MDKAKAAVSDFMSKSGHHDTTVHETVAPHVQRETVNEQRQEHRTIATDREVHQDHHHTSIQPVHDREVLPEQHHHNIVPVEHRSHDHRNHQETEARLQREAAQFKDETHRAPVQHTTHNAPAVSGEHVHHHVHETIQPVVHKETIEPHVVHTTVPIHEVHHNAAKHHAGSQLPAVSMADFKKQGGTLSGRDERVEHFSGEPRSVDRTTGHAMDQTGAGQHSSQVRDSNPGIGNTYERGLQDKGLPSNTNVGVRSGTTGAVGSGVGSHSHGTNDSLRNDGTYGSTSGVGNNNLSSTTDDNLEKKPSLLDRLNPMKDSDGDGKKGFMK